MVLYPSFYLSVCLCLCLPPSTCLSVSVSVPLCISVCLSVYVSLSLSLSLSLSHSFPPSIYPPFSRSQTSSKSLWENALCGHSKVSVFVSLPLTGTLPVCLPLYLPFPPSFSFSPSLNSYFIHGPPFFLCRPCRIFTRTNFFNIVLGASQFDMLRYI